MTWTAFSTLLALTLAAAGVEAQNSTDPIAQQVAERAPGLEREIDLAEIGYPQGFEFQQLSGEAVAFFPVGDAGAIDGMTLRLDLVHGETLSMERHLKVRAGDVIVHVEALGGDRPRRSVEIDLPADAALNGFVKIELSYAGANSGNICVDERSSGDFVRVLPTSSVRLTLDGTRLDSVDDVARIMPRRKVLEAAPDQSLSRAIPFALRAAALYDGEYGMVSIGAPPDGLNGIWNSTRLQLGESTAARDAEVSISTSARPGLIFSGGNPQDGLALVESRWNAIASATRTNVGEPRSTAEAIAFADLGAPELRQDVTGSSTFDFNFATEDFPQGQLPREFDLLIGAARTPTGGGVTVSAFLNGAMLGSRPLDSDEPTWISFAIPAGSLSRDNQLQVLVQRQIEGGNCRFAPQGYPAQILPQSRIVLAEAPALTSDFFLMRHAFARGVDVIAEPGIELDAELSWLLPVAGALLPDDADIAMHDVIAKPEEEDAPRPFLYVGRTAPGGADPAVRFDQGGTEVRDASDQLLYSGPALDDVGVVQIVEAEGRPGIWLRPGRGEAPAPTRDRPLLLDRGDLAFIDERGVAVVASTRRTSLVEVVYPERVDVLQVVAKYRPWIVGALWLALTLVVIRFLKAVYGRSRAEKGT